MTKENERKVIFLQFDWTLQKDKFSDHEKLTKFFDQTDGHPKNKMKSWALEEFYRFSNSGQNLNI